MTCSPGVTGKPSDKSRMPSSFIGRSSNTPWAARPVRLLDYRLGDRIARLAVPAGKPLPRTCVRGAILQACNLRRNERPHGCEPCESGGSRHVRNKIRSSGERSAIERRFQQTKLSFYRLALQAAVQRLLKKILKKCGPSQRRHRWASASATMSEIGAAAERHEVGGRLNIARRIRVSHFDDATGRHNAFEVRRRCTSSPQFMARCTTNSIRSSISLRGKSTSRGALLPWPSGALSRHRSPLARRRPRCMATSLHHFDTASRFGQTGRIRGRDRVRCLRLPYEHPLLSKRLAPAGGQRCRR